VGTVSTIPVIAVYTRHSGKCAGAASAFDFSFEHSYTSEGVSQGLLLLACPTVVHLQFAKTSVNRGLRRLNA